MTTDPPDEREDAPGATEEVSLRLALLDAQVVDADDLPVGRVDDLEIARDAGGRPLVVALLVGQRHLAPRIGGLTGALLGGVARRLAHDPGEGRVDSADIVRWTEMPQLRDRLADAPLAGLEKWLSSRVVRYVPGADDAGL